jgi:hypothetical protein
MTREQATRLAGAIAKHTAAMLYNFSLPDGTSPKVLQRNITDAQAELISEIEKVFESSNINWTGNVQ